MLHVCMRWEITIYENVKMFECLYGAYVKQSNHDKSESVSDEKMHENRCIKCCCPKVWVPGRHLKTRISEKPSNFRVYIYSLHTIPTIPGSWKK